MESLRPRCRHCLVWKSDLQPYKDWPVTYYCQDCVHHDELRVYFNNRDSAIELKHRLGALKERGYPKDRGDLMLMFAISKGIVKVEEQNTAPSWWFGLLPRR